MIWTSGNRCYPQDNLILENVNFKNAYVKYQVGKVSLTLHWFYLEFFYSSHLHAPIPGCLPLSHCIPSLHSNYNASHFCCGTCNWGTQEQRGKICLSLQLSSSTVAGVQHRPPQYIPAPFNSLRSWLSLSRITRI